MRIGQEELKSVLQNFRWIDDIPEDQNKRDEICVEARTALLLEANIDSEMMPAFIRGPIRSGFTILRSPPAATVQR